MPDARVLVDARHHVRDVLLPASGPDRPVRVLVGTTTAFHRLDPVRRKEGTSCY
ncbi:hypothetical protein ACIRVF_05300 [Kitasatospora sp. NPDC101157]|uniref:hypothetical protein n=1 Tax=Kitasatospora sp. NPDC101157 TaxID=3364098 RepID=UPI0038073191